jgi:hypothetical protein
MVHPIQQTTAIVRVTMAILKSKEARVAREKLMAAICSVCG